MNGTFCLDARASYGALYTINIASQILHSVRYTRGTVYSRDCSLDLFDYARPPSLYTPSRADARNLILEILERVVPVVIEDVSRSSLVAYCLTDIVPSPYSWSGSCCGRSWDIQDPVLHVRIHEGFHPHRFHCLKEVRSLRTG